MKKQFRVFYLKFLQARTKESHKWNRETVFWQFVYQWNKQKRVFLSLKHTPNKPPFF